MNTAERYGLDWTRLQQRRASDPSRSAWVSANAGSGKTHVLAQRVIRLLLAGCRPSSILCLTYTKAAASEMSNRVFARLAGWTGLDDAALAEDIADMEGNAPDAATLLRARQLFARALETPGGLKIQTIHAFCEAILHQFPLEANVAGHFEVLDETATRDLIGLARQDILTRVAAGGEPPLSAAFSLVLDEAGEWGLDRLFDEIVRNRSPIRAFLTTARSIGGVDAVLRRATGLKPDESEETVRNTAWPLDGLDEAALDLYVQTAASVGGAAAKKFAGELVDITRRVDPGERFDGLASLLLTQKGEPISTRNLATKPILDAMPDAADRISAAGEGIKARIGRLNLLRTVRLTGSALVIAEILDADYERLKRRSGALDFDDLVGRTADLLGRDGAGAWVHYKLDRGIDHILVDEAQDTSPQQWQVISRLAEEFFVGRSSREELRTLFAVGDEKQSIYSFQGARPELFAEKGTAFKRSALDAERHFEPLRLYLSFRSTSDVLSAVDLVFEPAENRVGLTSMAEDLVHASNRRREPGIVDIWEMAGKEKAADEGDWTAPFDAVRESAPSTLVAKRVAATVSDWLERGETVVREGRRRPIRPGDILVLVRKRDVFVTALMRELKRAGIAVAGADRLRLTDHIAVEDLMALGRVMLMPQDDLSLAAVLKSPLFGFDEDALFHLAAGRGEKQSLFDRLGDLGRGEQGRWLEADTRLRLLLALADQVPAFEFYARILGRDGARASFLARLGSEANDVLDEFLAFALEHETDTLPGLQAFLARLDADSPEIKREMEQGRDEVRIMTVHASKGLEAPVVFLVDSGGKPAEQSHMPHLHMLPLDSVAANLPPAPLWLPSSSLASPVAEHLKQSWAAATEAEYRRLLYVGLTRAADRLVICGYHGLRLPSHRHWHRLVSETLVDSGRARDMAFSVNGLDWAGARFTTTGQADDFELELAPADEPYTQSLPPALAMPLPQPARLPRPLAPSSAGLVVDDEETAGTGRARLFAAAGEPPATAQRGRLIHGLLQHLPGYDPALRRELAERHTLRVLGPGHDAEAESIVASVLSILDDERFASVFGPGSAAEVSVMGTLLIAAERRAVSARIDRISVSADRVLIIDYKTGRPPADGDRTIPRSYVLQLAIYRALLQQIYPGRTVEAALLYTEAPLLVSLGSAELDDALSALTTK